MLGVELEEETGIFYVSSSGDYEVSDFVRVARMFIDEHSELSRIKQISDFRVGKLKFEWYSILAQLTGLTDQMKELTSTFESVHAAIVYGTDANKGLISFFMNLRKPDNYHPKIFYDIDEAREWLEQQ